MFLGILKSSNGTKISVTHPLYGDNFDRSQNVEIVENGENVGMINMGILPQSLVGNIDPRLYPKLIFTPITQENGLTVNNNNKLNNVNNVKKIQNVYYSDIHTDDEYKVSE